MNNFPFSFNILSYNEKKQLYNVSFIHFYKKGTPEFEVINKYFKTNENITFCPGVWHSFYISKKDFDEVFNKVLGLMFEKIYELAKDKKFEDETRNNYFLRTGIQLPYDYKNNPEYWEFDN